MSLTSIAVKSETREMLEKLKRDNKAKSLDEAIQMMIRQVKRPKKSMFGAFKDLPEFKREELDRFD